MAALLFMESRGYADKAAMFPALMLACIMALTPVKALGLNPAEFGTLQAGAYADIAIFIIRDMVFLVTDREAIPSRSNRFSRRN